MKSKILFIAALLLIAVPATVMAVEDEEPQEIVEPKRTRVQYSLDDLLIRKEERKARIKEKVSEAKQKQVQARCKASQGKINSAVSKTNGIYTKRQNAYQVIGDKLNSLVSRLEAQGVDISTLNNLTTELSVKTDKFFDDYDLHLLALEDAGNMDCETDPETFYMALQDARAQLKELKTQSQEIHTYLTKQVRAELVSLKKQLSKGNSDNSDSTGSSDTEDSTDNNEGSENNDSEES